MHTYSLHRSVKVECLCCRVERDFTFTSSSDQIVCKSCIRHQGQAVVKANQRDGDHVGLWKSELEVAKISHSADITLLQSGIARRENQLAEQRTQIADLQATVRSGVESAPLPAVERWYADEKVGEAQQQRDGAYRSRDHAYRALWRLARLHREDDNRDEHCVCRRTLNGCKEWRAIAGALPALNKWEQNQIDRLRSGQPDGLPDDHPEVLRHGATRARTWNRLAG